MSATGTMTPRFMGMWPIAKRSERPVRVPPGRLPGEPLVDLEVAVQPQLRLADVRRTRQSRPPHAGRTRMPAALTATAIVQTIQAW